MRCVYFHRQFGNRRIKPGVMRKVMALAGLKYKKVEVCSVPNRLEERQEEFDDYIMIVSLFMVCTQSWTAS